MDFVEKLVPPDFGHGEFKIKVPWPNETMVGLCKAGKLVGWQKKYCLSSMACHNHQVAKPITPTCRFEDQKTGDTNLCILTC